MHPSCRSIALTGTLTGSTSSKFSSANLRSSWLTALNLISFLICRKVSSANRMNNFISFCSEVTEWRWDILMRWGEEESWTKEASGEVIITTPLSLCPCWKLLIWKPATRTASPFEGLPPCLTTINKLAGATSNYLLSHTLILEQPWDAYQIKAGGWSVRKDWGVPEGGGGVGLFGRSTLTDVAALNAKQAWKAKKWRSKKKWCSQGVTCSLISQIISCMGEARQPARVNVVHFFPFSCKFLSTERQEDIHSIIISAFLCKPEVNQLPVQFTTYRETLWAGFRLCGWQHMATV